MSKPVRRQALSYASAQPSNSALRLSNLLPLNSALRGLALAVAVVMLSACSKFFPAEEPNHSTIAVEDGFEQRQYEAYVVAEVRLEGEQKEALRAGFRILFDYISGENVAGTELSMTAPVTQAAGDEDGEKLAMTAPVTQKAEGPSWRVGFVMPEGRTLANLPAPLDARIRLRAVPPRKLFVHRFSGTWDREALATRTQSLLAAAERHGLRVASDPMFAFYDDPTVPWFLRRNEVMVEARP